MNEHHMDALARLDREHSRSSIMAPWPRSSIMSPLARSSIMCQTCFLCGEPSDDGEFHQDCADREQAYADWVSERQAEMRGW